MNSFTFAGMWTIINGFISQLSEVSSGLCTAVLPLVWGGAAIQITWQGFNILRGQGGSKHALDVFAKRLRVMIVAAVALEECSYNLWIVGMINGPDGLVNGIVSLIPVNPGVSPFANLDFAFQAG